MFKKLKVRIMLIFLLRQQLLNRLNNPNHRDLGREKSLMMIIFNLNQEINVLHLDTTRQGSKTSKQQKVQRIQQNLNDRLLMLRQVEVNKQLSVND